MKFLLPTAKSGGPGGIWIPWGYLAVTESARNSSKAKNEVVCWTDRTSAKPSYATVKIKHNSTMERLQRKILQTEMFYRLSLITIKIYGIINDGKYLLKWFYGTKDTFECFGPNFDSLTQNMLPKE